MPRRLGGLGIGVLLALLGAASALAADSDLDQGFGSGGTSRLYIGPLGDAIGTCIRLLPDGRMLVAGTMADRDRGGDIPFAARLLADGRLDTSYAAAGPTPGYVELTGASAGLACTALGDGSLVLAADRDTGGFVFSKVRSDGSLDASFGTHAYRVEGLISRLRTDDAGRILAVGDSGSGNSTTPLITRLTADGSPDPTFGSNGDVLLRSATSAPNTTGRFGDIVARPGGGYEAVGTVWDGTSTGSLLLTRLRADGSPDPNLGPSSTPGTVVDKLGFGANDGQTGWSSLLVDGQGRTIVGGEARWKVAIARVGASGAPDATFGDGSSPPGTEVFSAIVNGYDTGYGSASAVFARPSGGYALVGSCTSIGFAFAAVTADGHPDAGFAPGSEIAGERCVAAGYSRGSTSAQDAAVDSAGRLVAVGSSMDPPQDGYTYDRLTLMRTVAPAAGATATPGGGPPPGEPATGSPPATTPPGDGASPASTTPAAAASTLAPAARSAKRAARPAARHARKTRHRRRSHTRRVPHHRSARRHPAARRSPGRR